MSKLEEVARVLDPLGFRVGNSELIALALNKARAVLHVLMEPSEGMVAAGSDAVIGCYSLEPGEGFDEPPAPAAWRAMVQAALEGK